MMAKVCLLPIKIFNTKLIKMRKRTTKNGKLVASANSNEQTKVKYYDKKPIKKEDNKSSNFTLKTKTLEG